MRNRAPSIAVLVMTGLILAASGPVAAYLKLGSRVQGRTVTLKWERLPIRYHVTDIGTAGVSAAEFQRAGGVDLEGATEEALSDRELLRFPVGQREIVDGRKVVRITSHDIRIGRDHGRVVLPCVRAAGDESDLVLVHGDLGTHNLAFDPVTRRVTGLYDFEGFALRDRHHDSKYLPSYGPAVMARVLDEYRRRTGVTLRVERIRLWHLATADVVLSMARGRSRRARSPVEPQSRSSAGVGRLALFAIDEA
jgi:hypothetical protein